MSGDCKQLCVFLSVSLISKQRWLTCSFSQPDSNKDHANQNTNTHNHTGKSMQCYCGGDDASTQFLCDKQPVTNWDIFVTPSDADHNWDAGNALARVNERAGAYSQVRLLCFPFLLSCNVFMFVCACSSVNERARIRRCVAVPFVVFALISLSLQCVSSTLHLALQRHSDGLNHSLNAHLQSCSHRTPPRTTPASLAKTIASPASDGSEC